jgi:GrpB protein
MPGPPVLVFEDYDLRYPAVFDQLVSGVRALVGDVRVEHVGSTSVPGKARVGPDGVSGWLACGLAGG